MGIITFNNISSKSVGLEVETFPDYVAPQKIYEVTHVPGRNGDLVRDTKTYETKEYIIIYEVTGFNRYNQAIWGFKEIKVKKQLCQDTMKT